MENLPRALALGPPTVRPPVAHGPKPVRPWPWAQAQEQIPSILMHPMWHDNVKTFCWHDHPKDFAGTIALSDFAGTAVLQLIGLALRKQMFN